jgi:hypothetical protein
MNPHGNRARLGGILAVCAAAVALVALPGLASAHRGHDDLADAGTIQSFDPASGVLTIDLTGGGSASGLVTPRTHIHCDNGRHKGRHGLRHHLRHGEGEPGDDHHANGDDPPGHDGTAPGRSEGPGKGAEHGERCSTDDLTAGKTVKFANLVLVDGKAIFTLVALPKSDEGS